MAEYVLYKLGPFDLPNGLARRWVRVFLPPRRGEATPALYMFDGQNVFHDEPAYAGGWHLHRAIERISKRTKRAPAIVGVDHGGVDRIHELAPFASDRARGQLDSLLDWMTSFLLGRVADEFGLARGPEHTAIGGSSMGGLAAVYAHFKRPEAFGGVLSMSPSLWFGGRRFFDFVASCSRPWTSRIYIDAGAKEGRAVEHARRLAEHLQRDKHYDKNALRFLSDKRGTHSEASWRRRAPVALRFLFRLNERAHHKGPLAT